MRRLLTITFTLFAMLTSAKGLRLQTLGNGLAGQSVTRLVEDPTGKMWMATSNGVSLYNGQSFKNYDLPRQKNGLTNLCHDIALDKDGNVWVASKAGVFHLRRYEEAFRQVAPEITLSECVICVGDTAYVGCRGGLYAITAKGQAKSIDISVGQQRGNNSVRCLRRQQGYLWLTVRTGLIRMELKTHRMRFYPLETPSGLSRFDILGDSLYVGTKNNGIYRMSVKSGQSESVNATFNVVNDVIASPEGLLCIATDGYGACLIDIPGKGHRNKGYEGDKKHCRRYDKLNLPFFWRVHFLPSFLLRIDRRNFCYRYLSAKNVKE